MRLRFRHSSSVLFLWLTIQSLVSTAQFTSPRLLNTEYADSPYELKSGRELGLLGAGVVTYGVSVLLDKAVDPLTPDQVSALDRNDINAFDRPATANWNPSIAKASDITLYTNVALPALLTLGLKPMRQDVKTLGIMYIETLLLANGVESTVKALSQRPRPFVFNPDVPLERKLNRDARQSFFSGHATTAFATAVFTSEVFRHYFPYSKLKPVVWAGTLGLATATCVMRYESGRHYYTDLLAGAAFGSLVGWVIPKLHEVKNRGKVGRRFDIQPWTNGSSTGLYTRFQFHSRSRLYP
ncbi:phosphatase PAP2 family protein [Spirosoma sp. RP8]|uniref:Phosphatase PAP2 family protein n=1 Tax=Spirosoma liriopis TaxID=2937440 RepID=A0ABT0HP39_9BACT|nr:phosphatase PAP2 family protein [Spirosoma liriopis]MCK8493403.1 phosphatase PAP2 family protein [Spirosoma liriopis]